MSIESTTCFRFEVAVSVNLGLKLFAVMGDVLIWVGWDLDGPLRQKSDNPLESHPEIPSGWGTVQLIFPDTRVCLSIVASSPCPQLRAEKTGGKCFYLFLEGRFILNEDLHLRNRGMLSPYWALHSLLRVHGNLCATQFPICSRTGGGFSAGGSTNTWTGAFSVELKTG